MAPPDPYCTSLAPELAARRCAGLRAQLTGAGLFASPVAAEGTAHQATTSWRISPCPLFLSPDQLTFFQNLGPQLLTFYRALNRLYLDSVKGTQPAWVARYLDQGKPDSLVTYSRMKRFRDDLPAVIRPDVIPTQDGMVITELDSVPGGIGLTACLSMLYGNLDDPPLALVGGRDGMIERFAAMLQAQQGTKPGCIAVVVSEEAKDYRPEMTWLTARLRERGLSAYCVEPREVRFTEEGLQLHRDGSDRPIALVYRFYELFDLLNIPKAELIQYAVKKDWAAVTPPYKPALEEKSAFALLHHPVLRPFWEKELGGAVFLDLTSIMPRTWLLDPTPIPPSATIPGLQLGGRAVTDWRELATATQKERHYVIKPSGFSELAWGSRGVSVGHDLPQAEWAAAIDQALASFSRTPYILQEFHKGRLFELDYWNPQNDTMEHMTGRARLSPYYFVAGGKAELAGILATVCSAEKKVIHGMKDAVMVPCAVR